MEESRYAIDSVSLENVSSVDTYIAITGVRIIVRNPLDSSDIIRAIFFLGIVYFNLNVGIWEVWVVVGGEK